MCLINGVFVLLSQTNVILNIKKVGKKSFEKDKIQTVR